MIWVLLNVRGVMVRRRGHGGRTAVRGRPVVIALRVLRVVHHKCDCPTVGRAVAIRRYLVVLRGRVRQT